MKHICKVIRQYIFGRSTVHACNEKKFLKKGFKIAIIGCGDVVSNRILPALLKKVDRNSLSIYADNIPKDFKENIKCNEIKHLDETVKDLSKFQMIWIASPSNAHFFYLEKLLNINNFIVVEKPITVNQNELDIVKQIVQSEFRNKIFFLSYYTLEKALPLTYITNQSKHYEKYLNISCEKSKLFSIISLLGNLKKIDVYIIEGEDNRKWVYSHDNGGQLLETFLHNVMIAYLFVGNPNNWSHINLSYGDYVNLKEHKSPNVINLEAISEDKEVHLLMAKNIKDKQKLKRGALLEFQNGNIVADFTQQKIIITCDKIDEKIIIEVDKMKYIGKYDVQVDLAMNCFNNHICPEKIDGLDNQIEIIEWLLKLKEKHYNELDSLMIDELINATICGV